MRLRDQQLYHLKQRGYERAGTQGDVEIWAKPDDPEDIVLIRANPAIPKAVLDALIEDFERE